MEFKAYFQELSQTGGQAWEKFWFTPASPIWLGRLRIAVALLAVAYFLSWTNHLSALLGRDGLLPPSMVQELFREQNRHLYRFSPLYQIDSPAGLQAYQVLAVAVAVLFTAGVFTRVTSVATFVVFLTFVHRAPMLTGPLDTVLAMLLLYLAIGPSGEVLSVDAWLAHQKARTPQAGWLANVSLRLIQVHTAGLLLLVACSSMASGAWWDGTAIWALEAQSLSRPFDWTSLRNWPKLVNGWTHLFVVTNLLFPVLVWNRLLRPLVLTITAVVWLLMIPLSGQVLYVLAVLTALAAFLAHSKSDVPSAGA